MIEGLSVESLFTPVATLVSVAVAFGVLQARQQTTGKALDRLSENIDSKFAGFDQKLDRVERDVGAIAVAQEGMKQQLTDQNRRLESHSRVLEARPRSTERGDR